MSKFNVQIQNAQKHPDSRTVVVDWDGDAYVGVKSVDTSKLGLPHFTVTVHGTSDVRFDVEMGGSVSWTDDDVPVGNVGGRRFCGWVCENAEVQTKTENGKNVYTISSVVRNLYVTYTVGYTASQVAVIIVFGCHWLYTADTYVNQCQEYEILDRDETVVNETVDYMKQMLMTQYRVNTLDEFALFSAYHGRSGAHNRIASVEVPRYTRKDKVWQQTRDLYRALDYIRDTGDIKLTILVVVGDATVQHLYPGGSAMCGYRESDEDRVSMFKAANAHWRRGNKDSPTRQSRQMLTIFDGNLCDKLIPGHYSGTYEFKTPKNATKSSTPPFTTKIIASSTYQSITHMQKDYKFCHRIFEAFKDSETGQFKFGKTYADIQNDPQLIASQLGGSGETPSFGSWKHWDCSPWTSDNALFLR